MAIRNDAHRDEFHRDQQWHKPVRVATTAPVTISTALNAGDTIDGVTLAAGDRVLVKDQSTGSQNGIYIAGASPARAYDMLVGIQAMGAFVYVINGTANGGTLWHCTNLTLPTIASTALTWTEFTAGSSTTTIPFDHGNMGATETVDLANGDWHRGTLTANCAITVQGFTVDEGAVLLFEVAQDGTGGWGITWDADVDFGGGDDQPSLTASTTTTFLLWSSVGDSTIYGAKVGAGSTGLTIQDEGTPLSTAATTLNFVGSGVVASGTGATKTITVAGATAADISALGFVGPILISDTPSNPLVFDDLLQNDDGTDLLYADL